jgi:hypothetical protein
VTRIASQRSCKSGGSCYGWRYVLRCSRHRSQAVWHLPDHFAEEGCGVDALISAPIIFAVEFVSLFFARALFVWFYNVTAFSVLLVAIFHASFDGAINQLSYDIVPASNTARFLIFSAVIVLAATIVIIASKGRLGRAKEAVATQTDVSDLDT